MFDFGCRNAPNLHLKTPVDPLKDLVPVASLVSNDLILAANPSLPRSSPRRFCGIADR